MVITRLYPLEVLGLVLVPLLGPVVLRIGGVSGDLAELWAVIVGPIVYLALGMAVSSVWSSCLRAHSDDPRRDRLAKRFHDAKIASLFFLALFEGAACLFAVEPHVPTWLMLFVVVFYIPYLACAILSLRYLLELRQIAQAHPATGTDSPSSGALNLLTRDTSDQRDGDEHTDSNSPARQSRSRA